jgi:spoIIIJ-associated protein
MEKANKMQKDVQALIEELLYLIGVEGTAEVTLDDSNKEEKLIKILINADKEAGLLIGNRGATLNAIQSFVSIAIRQKTGEWVRVLVDIGEWRQKHEEYLADLAKQTAERAKSTGEPQHLYNLTPAQRRVIHLALQNEKGIVSESEGEGEGRYLVVKSE